MKQIYPASITGKGFAAGGSVLDHKFGATDPFTLGVEEEYMLLDPTTFDLVQHIDTVLTAVSEGEFVERIGPELMQSVLEISTPVCHTAADVDTELRRLRGYVTDIAREQDLRVGSSGTHPFSLFEQQRITARDRYRNLVDQLQYVARRELIFGLHVHVAVDAPDKAIHVMSALLTHLSELLAFSASSRRLAASPTTPTSGGTSGPTCASARSRFASWTRSPAWRRPSRSRPTCRRSSSTTAIASRRAPSCRATTASSRRRTNGSRPVTASRRRSWTWPRDGGTACPSRSSSAACCARSSRTRASSAPSASSRASGRSSAAATAPTASSRSSTPTGTSSRSSGRSRTLPRRPF